MAVDLSDLQKKKLDSLTKSNEVVTAFLVTQTREGQWVTHIDFQSKDLVMDRMATFDDVVSGAANVQAAAIVQQTAGMTMSLMDQRAQMAQQYTLQQQEAQRVASRINPDKLRV